MADSETAMAQNGLNILMELASDRAPISRSALKDRCSLGAAQLDETLRFLTERGVVRREVGARGRYCLAKPPEDIRLSALSQRARRAGHPPMIPGLDHSTTLAELHAATISADGEICPYYEACVSLGGPSGLGTEYHCRCDGME